MYYVSNAKSELKIVAQKISDEKIFNVLNNINSDNEFDINKKETEQNQEDELIAKEENIEDNINDEELQIENYFNLIDKELAILLQIQEVQVFIEPKIVNHGDKNFDLEELLQE